MKTEKTCTCDETSADIECDIGKKLAEELLLLKHSDDMSFKNGDFKMLGLWRVIKKEMFDIAREKYRFHATTGLSLEKVIEEMVIEKQATIIDSQELSHEIFMRYKKHIPYITCFTISSYLFGEYCEEELGEKTK